MKLSVKVINKANAKMKNITDNILSNGLNSVEDATRFAHIKWQTLIPKKTGESCNNIYKYITKENKNIVGYVVSPAHTKPKDFYLNVFLERGSSPGAKSTTVRGSRYKLRTGVFGAARVTAKETRKYFDGVVRSRIKTTISAYKK